MDKNNKGIQKVIFLMFLVSGFCGLLYQVIWIRIAYASFGVITPVMSVVISVFMLGLLIGSAAGGALAKKLARRFRISAILLYAAAELFIGTGAFCVPKLFLLEQHWLLTLGSMNSFGYLSVSALAIAVALLPWCIVMGFTYPFMMTFVRELDPEAGSSFSFLYLANVVGAMAGTILTAAVLIELFGFSSTLAIAAACNFIIAAASFAIGRKKKFFSPEEKTETAAEGPLREKRRLFMLLLLFISGLVSMCMEIIWIRNFTPVLKTVVYSFASLLSVYLFASWAGSYLYRRHLSRQKCFSIEALLCAIALFSLLPLVVNDPRIPFKGAFLIFFSIIPLCGALGYLTPQLIDRYSKGSPSLAGYAYSINTLGCIIGPLLASYLLLPVWGVKVSLVLLSVVLLLCFLGYFYRSLLRHGWSIGCTAAFAALLTTGLFVNDTYEEYFHLHSKSVMKRDYAATVTAIGATMGEKQLLVNGIGMTYLTPITQFMAHLPLALCEKRPASALVICFGMGTTFRSLVSWGINATAVELIPGVPKMFSYYWPDADSILNNPKAEVVIDDGRRYLMRTDKKFDVITIDPPPPMSAAGSSLLYSVEMYTIIKKRLKDGGILLQWIPGNDPSTIEAAARSVAVSFPYIKVYRSIEGWGYHVLASMKPFRQLTAPQMVSRMPEKARKDLSFWCKGEMLEGYVGRMLSGTVPLDSLFPKESRLLITDASPYNEYFLLRQVFGGSQSELERQIRKFIRPELKL